MDDLNSLMGLGGMQRPAISDRTASMEAIQQRFARNKDAEFEYANVNPYGSGGHGDNQGVPQPDEEIDLSWVLEQSGEPGASVVNLSNMNMPFGDMMGNLGPGDGMDSDMDDQMEGEMGPQMGAKPPPFGGAPSMEAEAPTDNEALREAAWSKLKNKGQKSTMATASVLKANRDKKREY